MNHTRRDFLRKTALAAGAAAVGKELLATAEAAAQSTAQADTQPARKATQTVPSKKPNFLVIVVDDMGYSDIGCYGGEISTPNLDGLAANGLRFTQVYSTARCWPSRACILTGYYAQQVRRDHIQPDLAGGTQGVRPAWAKLLPALLKPAGYLSYHSGKWHVDGDPVANGFDASYSNSDSDHHFLKKEVADKLPPPLEPQRCKEGYFASTAAADQAIRQLRRHAEKHADQPFFEYLAFTEPHFPIQALQEDIARYKDRYHGGWDKLRQERWKKMTDLGLIHCGLPKPDPDILPKHNLPGEQLQKRLSPGEAPKAVPWETLAQEQKDYNAAKMAIHAAMVDRIDQEVGRVLKQIKDMGAMENTVILFVSDNGCSAEQIIRAGGHDPAAPLGSAKSFLCLGPGWSTASNTPFRLHKIWVHEGGISSPLIVHWPAGIAARGELRHNVGHFVDIVPTLLELAGAERPQTLDDKPVPAPPGKSLVPVFSKDGTVQREALWWYHQGNHAIRIGDMKAVTEGDGPWELYDLAIDRCESNNLAAQQPQKAQELAAKWRTMADEIIRVAKSDGKAPAMAAPKGKK